MHGTAVSGQDDRDEMGVCLEPPELVTGLARVPAGVGGAGGVVFQQYHRHTTWDRPGGLANRSGADDLDVVVCSARKWARPAPAGNPAVLLLLFVADEEVGYRDEVGTELIANAHRFVSRRAAERYLGHLRKQKAAITGEAGARTDRPELVADHGYDCESAVPAPGRGAVGRGAGRGRRRRAAAGRAAGEPAVPLAPDAAWVDGWLHSSHLAYWATLR